MLLLLFDLVHVHIQLDNKSLAGYDQIYFVYHQATVVQYKKKVLKALILTQIENYQICVKLFIVLCLYDVMR